MNMDRTGQKQGTKEMKKGKTLTQAKREAAEWCERTPDGRAVVLTFPNQKGYSIAGNCSNRKNIIAFFKDGKEVTEDEFTWSEINY